MTKLFNIIRVTNKEYRVALPGRWFTENKRYLKLNTTAILFAHLLRINFPTWLHYHNWNSTLENKLSTQLTKVQND